tara:strand:- start:7887 stop:8051 length:165 start_codon:yes stop_codon:yes gene_type:complete
MRYYDHCDDCDDCGDDVGDQGDDRAVWTVGGVVKSVENCILNGGVHCDGVSEEI